MKIFFRVDASFKIGSGHVIRCLTLAKELKKKGAICKFISKDHKENLIEKIIKENFEVIVLPLSRKTKKIKTFKDPNIEYSDWIGSSWEEDAKQTIKALNKEKIDWLIIDHYGIDEKWEKKLKSYCKKMMVIDDLANRKHDCDLLLDQNLTENYNCRYKNLLSKNCSLLLGPRYALLQKEYKKLHIIAPPRIGPPKNILVYFGSMDKNKFTKITLISFLKLKAKNIKLDIVINSNNPQIKIIQRLTKKNKNIKIHSDLESLSSLILKADLAFGAGGSTSWERCCLGLPSIVISVANNQKPIAKELHKRGLIRWLGHHDKIKKNLIYKELKNLIKEDLEDWSKKCRLISDGCGAEIIASILTLDNKTKLQIRAAGWKDKNFYQNFSELNNKNKLTNKFEKSFYFNLRNQDKHRIYILEMNSKIPVCQVQFDLTKEGWIIKYRKSIYIQNPKLKRYFIEIAINKFRSDVHGLIIFAPKEKNKKKLSISICSEKKSWINFSITFLIYTWINQGHTCSWTHEANHLEHGDLCFYLSYEKIVKKTTRKKFKNNLVVHASDLPLGKGWSPLSWQILKGYKRIIISLFEADNKVDSGKIYMQSAKKFSGHELLNDLRKILANATYDLCCNFINHYPKCLKKGKAQNGKETFYPRRLLKDSKLDLEKSINEQFNLLRIVDNDNYPAFFEKDGYKYVVSIKKVNN